MDLYDRLKALVAEKAIGVHRKSVPVTVPDTTHWIQVAGDRDYHPIMPDKHVVGNNEHVLGNSEHGLGNNEHGLGNNEHGLGNSEHVLGIIAAQA